MSNLIDDYRALTANVVTDPHLTRWRELLATTEKVLNKYRLSPALGEAFAPGTSLPGAFGRRAAPYRASEDGEHD
jgi:hypothetical protein